MTLKELQKRVHQTALAKGWYSPAKSTTESLMLSVCELAEAVEEIRDHKPHIYQELKIGSGHVALIPVTSPAWNEDAKPEGLAIEIADAVIRLADLCEHLKIDLSTAVEMKMKYNETRSTRHGGKLL